MCLVILLSLASELCVRQGSGLAFLLSSEVSWDILPKIPQQSIGRAFFFFFFSSVDINTLTCLWSKLPSTHGIGTHCPAFCFSGDLSKSWEEFVISHFLTRFIWWLWQQLISFEGLETLWGQGKWPSNLCSLSAADGVGLWSWGLYLGCAVFWLHLLIFKVGQADAYLLWL